MQGTTARRTYGPLALPAGGLVLAGPPRSGRRRGRGAALPWGRVLSRGRGSRLLTGLWEMDRLRSHVAAVGDDLEKGQSTLINDVKPQAFAHPFEIRERKKR